LIRIYDNFIFFAILNKSMFGFFSFIRKYVTASKHCRWSHVTDRQGTFIRILPSYIHTDFSQSLHTAEQTKSVV